MSVKRLYAPQKPRPARRGNHNQPVAGQLSAASSSPFDYEAALRACARGERSALQKLYEQESPRLLGVVQRIVRDAALAEDIVHDAFIRIWNKAATYDQTRGSARGWIFSVTRHLALNAVRNDARQMLMDPDEERETSHAAIDGWQEQTDAFDWRVNPGRIEACLEQLEPVRRNCVFHAYVDGYSHQEIAQRLGAPLGTVKAWIRRSLTALRECIG
ncbi:sigma-70 family RNA polymerase sigma factor [Pseudomonas sp. MTM4]|nr:sigma-70 family RNA polymerase sigma factor [Stutzerimonas stutzeri]MBC8650351.1 sigma-70 family RNA polymerase sigma factor [Pseudomonas sp. MT4]QXY93615.1 sigma-70 family RNA polymerase sigma factor [Pseudomonas sp. MTM4]